MPTIFTHAIAAFCIGKGFFKNLSSKVLLAGILCSMLPDADVIGFKFGIRYESLWGHRGITHSFFFAFIVATILMLIFYKSNPQLKKQSWLLFSFFFLATASHPILDAFTNGGLGVAFFSPFSNHRYFFEFQPIQVSPIGASGFFTSRGLSVIISELKFVWAPCFLFLAFSLLLRKRIG